MIFNPTVFQFPVMFDIICSLESSTQGRYSWDAAKSACVLDSFSFLQISATAASSWKTFASFVFWLHF